MAGLSTPLSRLTPYLLEGETADYQLVLTVDEFVITNRSRLLFTSKTDKVNCIASIALSSITAIEVTERKLSGMNAHLLVYAGQQFWRLGMNNNDMALEFYKALSDRVMALRIL